MPHVPTDRVISILLSPPTECVVETIIVLALSNQEIPTKKVTDRTSDTSHFAFIPEWFLPHLAMYVDNLRTTQQRPPIHWRSCLGILKLITMSPNSL